MPVFGWLPPRHALKPQRRLVIGRKQSGLLVTSPKFWDPAKLGDIPMWGWVIFVCVLGMASDFFEHTQFGVFLGNKSCGRLLLGAFELCNESILAEILNTP